MDPTSLVAFFNALRHGGVPLAFIETPIRQILFKKGFVLSVQTLCHVELISLKKGMAGSMDKFGRF